MASTNEDVVVLRMAALEDGGQEILILRHLPDRGTVEIGWWVRESGAVVPPSAVLELAAEAVEIDGLMRLCTSLLANEHWEAAGEGSVLDEASLGADGARIAAVRSQAGLTLVRRPEGGELVLPSRAALVLLVGLFPTVRLKLIELGFGLPQQSHPASGSENQA